MTASASIKPAFRWLDVQPYVAMWQSLLKRAADVAKERRPEVLWSCEHEPVYTTGRRGVDNRLRSVLGAPLIYTDRGGETTFHGPGQVMLYPVVSLRRRRLSPRTYVYLLEQSCIDCLETFGIHASRRPALPGVWLQTGKVAALGLRITGGVAYHGMALNVCVDDDWFDAIDACGTGLPSVSLKSVLPDAPACRTLALRWASCFRRLL